VSYKAVNSLDRTRWHARRIYLIEQQFSFLIILVTYFPSAYYTHKAAYHVILVHDLHVAKEF